ncbi:MAG: site-2 protease family protein [Phycisphaerae bacterium]
MSYGSRALDNPINWSFGIGRLFGIRIRVHLLFILGAVVILFANLDGQDQQGSLRNLGYGAGTLGILFSLVLLHELGHCWGAWRVGGQAEEILMWPLGGLASVSVPHTARANLITAVTGPAVNVIVCIVVAGILVALTGTGGSIPWNPFDAAGPAKLARTDAQWWLMVLFQVSYVLLLFNLAPVFPLDGGRVLQCLLWPSKGYGESTRIATGVGMVGAIGFGILAIITGAHLLLAIAFFGYITCHQQRRMLAANEFSQDNEFGYDFSRGYTSLDQTTAKPPKPGYFERRRMAKALRQAEKERQQLERHRARVDQILEKISELGPEALTPQERQVLQQETQRQRAPFDTPDQ